ncbi:MAG: hypothetical protein OEZ06_14340 [Myxococcales bacterium]|nr:hypothetical protein [Myxococcales bacterium]
MSGIFAPSDAGPWLFGRRTDLLIFGGSAALSLLLLAAGATLGVAETDTPPWLWLLCVVGVDVAHVWSTAFRVYLDPAELRRRRALYLGLPVLCYGAGLMAHAISALSFWRLLAYAAVYHFVRQQYGWVALYRRRAGECGRLDRVLDSAAIYAATVYPLLHWHGNLPRSFHWFLPGDFVPGLAAAVAQWLEPLYWAIGTAFCLRQLVLVAKHQAVNWGKVLVVLSTWLCWHLGIIAFDGDFAFTVTNVLIHGIPYIVLTYRYAHARARESHAPAGLAWLRWGGALGFGGAIILAAAAEEALWDRLIWHDHGWLFGEGVALADGVALALVPLLALPQALHYALDGFIWRVRSENPQLLEELGA